MKYFLYPYSKASASAKELAEGLGIKRIKREGSKFKGGPNKIIINWGNSSPLPDDFMDCQVINLTHLVAKASNKLLFFKMMGEDKTIPQWTTSRDEAVEWCRKGKVVVCRTILNGHSGKGIIIAHSEEQLVDAPLYVKYIKKAEEFRVHLFANEIIDIQRKARRLEHPDPNWEIRNHANGFIYQRNDVDPHKSVLEVAKDAFNRSELDFGAVDVIYNAKEGRAYVLEINTAPGLTGTTLQNYINAFKGVMR